MKKTVACSLLLLFMLVPAADCFAWGSGGGSGYTYYSAPPRMGLLARKRARRAALDSLVASRQAPPMQFCATSSFAERQVVETVFAPVERRTIVERPVIQREVFVERLASRVSTASSVVASDQVFAEPEARAIVSDRAVVSERGAQAQSLIIETEPRTIVVDPPDLEVQVRQLGEAILQYQQ